MRVPQAGPIGGAACKRTQDGPQQGGAGRQARDLVQADEPVLHALAEEHVLDWYRQRRYCWARGWSTASSPWPRSPACRRAPLSCAPF